MSEDALSRAIRIDGLLAEWEQESLLRIKQQPVACSRTPGGKSLRLERGRGGKLKIAFTTERRGHERLERAKIV